jgi:hypothetical protein
MSKKLRDTLGVLIAVPVLGVLMGGIYSLPAMRVTSGREPWLTILLFLGLSVTVLCIGFGTGLGSGWISVAWMSACVVLLVRRSFGKLDHSLERFGLLHALTVAGMLWLVLLVR